MFGIKNARRSAGQDEFVIGGGVEQFLALGFSIGLLPDDDIAFGYHVIQLPRFGNRLICLCLMMRQQVGVHRLGGSGEVGTPGIDSTFVVNGSIGIGIGQLQRGNCDGN